MASTTPAGTASERISHLGLSVISARGRERDESATQFPGLHMSNDSRTSTSTICKTINAQAANSHGTVLNVIRNRQHIQRTITSATPRALPEHSLYSKIICNAFRMASTASLSPRLLRPPHAFPGHHA
jgi:hypothetical protein